MREATFWSSLWDLSLSLSITSFYNKSDFGKKKVEMKEETVVVTYDVGRNKPESYGLSFL